MSKPEDGKISIEPLTKEENKDRGSPTVEDNPDYPETWKAKQVAELVNQGYRYYRRRMKTGKIYMVLRKGKKDKGIGLWSDAQEGKLFTFFPRLGVSGVGGATGMLPPAIGARAQFLSVPISRVAIVPRDYVPTINVIRYFEVMVEQGFPGDFSNFINDVITEHFVNCHGIKLPVVVEEHIGMGYENVEPAEPAKTATS
jgi:hypothetical protein